MTRTWLERLWYPQGDRGLSHALAAPPLALASWLYAAGAALAPRPTPTRVDGAFVVSVGNLTAGGAGKTPVVIFVTELALARGKKVGVLSRGYGRGSAAPVAFDARALPTADDAGDEPRLIAQRCPGARLYVGADRVASARAARAEGCDFLVLDDGFQHRALARDLDLVVVDDEVLFGSAHRLPWGPLREPPAALTRAGLVWRRAAADGQPRPALHGQEVRADHRVRPDPALAGRDVLVFTGIARPSAVVRSAQALGARVVATRFFADHHRFTASERDEARAAAAGALLVTTEKDAQRLPPGFAVPLVMDVALLDGEAKLLAALRLA